MQPIKMRGEITRRRRLPLSASVTPSLLRHSSIAPPLRPRKMVNSEDHIKASNVFFFFFFFCLLDIHPTSPSSASPPSLHHYFSICPSCHSSFDLLTRTDSIPALQQLSLSLSLSLSNSPLIFNTSHIHLHPLLSLTLPPWPTPPPPPSSLHLPFPSSSPRAPDHAC